VRQNHVAVLVISESDSYGQRQAGLTESNYYSRTNGQVNTTGLVNLISSRYNSLLGHTHLCQITNSPHHKPC
jgi:hypothetical protein